VRSFTDTYFPVADNIVPFENTTPIRPNQNNKGQNERTQNRLIRLHNWSGIFEGYNVVSVRQIWLGKRTRLYRSAKI